LSLILIPNSLTPSLPVLVHTFFFLRYPLSIFNSTTKGTRALKDEENMAVAERLHSCHQWVTSSFSTLQSYPLVQHITHNPRETSYAVVVVGIFIIVGIRAVHFFKTPKDVRARSPDLEKPVGSAGNPLKDPDRKVGGEKSFAFFGAFLLLRGSGGWV
jgi:hypothetical protein